MTRALVVMLQVAVVAGAAYANAQPRPYYDLQQKPRCRFSYDEKLETRALSILQHELSSNGAAFYDAARPVVTVCRSKATLIFGGTLQHNGHTLLDPPHIFVDVDVCSHRILNVDRDNGMAVTNGSPCE